MLYAGKIIIDKVVQNVKARQFRLSGFLVSSISYFKHSPNLVYHYNVEVFDLFHQDSPSLSQV